MESTFYSAAMLRSTREDSSLNGSQTVTLTNTGTAALTMTGINFVVTKHRGLLQCQPADWPTQDEKPYHDGCFRFVDA
jgi:hypothetical protein